MVTDEQELSLTEQAEQLEERFLLKEVDVLERLKKAAAKKSVSETQAVARELGALEADLNSVHLNALSHINVLLQSKFKGKAGELKAIENEIKDLATSIFSYVGARGAHPYQINRGGYLYEILRKEPIDFRAIINAVNGIEILVSKWLGLIKKIQDAFKIAKKA